MLKAAGFSIATFGSAEEFLRWDERHRPSCLVLDIRLPGMSGIEMQKRLIEENSTVPIVFISAHSDLAIRDLVMKAGAAGFLHKPVRSEALLRQIRAAIENTNQTEG